MTFFEKSLQDGYARKIESDLFRARNLIKAAHETLLTLKEISVKEENCKTLLRELYEAFHQYCEGIGYLQGYKFESHEVIVYYLRDVLGEESISQVFDKYRRLRNDINYYGRDVSLETVKKALQEIPLSLKRLEKYTR